MNPGAMLRMDFEREMQTTRRVLERIPTDKFDWKPHEKSMPLGGLASHVANVPKWAVFTIGLSELDPGTVKLPPATSSEELLSTFDANVAEALVSFDQLDGEKLAGPWSLLMNGKPLFTMPRAAVLQKFVLSHLIHHRGQLSVYLRLLDIPVPSIYGPSADENPFG
jgi:uncharacterized damage-inducible protein DinB